MLYLCCPDKFRGSLTAAGAAREMARGVQDAGHDTIELPLADGGEGTLDALLNARSGERVTNRVTGPLGDPVDADWGMLPDGTAVIEMAKSGGLALVGSEENDPIRATTRGTGELINAAIETGATRAIVAVGGSATVDGGLGALDALGWSLHGLPVIVACDVTTGFIDAATVFGPQKGANEDQVNLLIQRLQALADQYLRWTGRNVLGMRYAGAAGGLAGGLAAIGAKLCSGFDVVAEAVQLRDALLASDAVLTGEGKLDRASLDGKVVGEILKHTPSGTRCGIIVGDVAEDVDLLLPRAISLRSLSQMASSHEIALSTAGQLVRTAAREIADATDAG